MIYLQIADSLLPEDAAGQDEPRSLDAYLPVAEELLLAAAREAIDQQGVSSQVEITILLSDDNQLHELNRQFLGIDGPTDVLSFPAGEETDPDSEEAYLGDIIISVERARAQAESGGHSLESELQLLIVHGVLHLLGHDHAEEEEKAVMWAAQAEILQRLGVDDLQIQ